MNTSTDSEVGFGQALPRVQAPWVARGAQGDPNIPEVAYEAGEVSISRYKEQAIAEVRKALGASKEGTGRGSHMRLGVIVASHGDFARAALGAVEMVAGKQTDVYALGLAADTSLEDFEAEFNADYDKLMAECDDVAAICDIHGGTPFNVISRALASGKDMIAFTGLSMPVLIELMLTRDQLSGRADIRKLVLAAHAQTLGEIRLPGSEESGDGDAAPVPATKADVPVHPAGESIGNVRIVNIDDRLIHGQVATTWIPDYGVKSVIIVSDKVANDPVQKSVAGLAVPGIKVTVFSVDKFIHALTKTTIKRPTMVLFTNSVDALRLHDNGLPFTYLNVSGMRFNEERHRLHKNMSVTPEEKDAFERLLDEGVECWMQTTTRDTKEPVAELLKNYA